MKQTRRTRGSVFVYCLVVLAALIGVLAAVASTERLDVKATANRKEQVKARMACMAGVQRFIATEANDLLGGGATTSSLSSASTSTIAMTTGATTLQDDWAQLGSNGDENVIVGDVTLRMQVVDACSLVNLTRLIPSAQSIAAAAGSSVTQTQAPWLFNMPLTQQQIDAFVDFTLGAAPATGAYQSAAQTATSDGGKDAYYNGLAMPYNAKLLPLDTLDELLQVRYFNAAAIWQPNTNSVSTVTFVAQQNGQMPTLYDLVTPYSYASNLAPGPLGQQTAKTGITQASLTGILTPLLRGAATSLPIPVIVTQVFSFQNSTHPMGTLLSLVPANVRATLLDSYYIALSSAPGTPTATGKLFGLINLNTASQNVLLTVPGLTPDVASAIVTQQQTGFTKLSDVLNVAGFSGAALNTIDYFCVQSSTFIVRVIGYCGSTSVAMEATVDIVPATSTTPATPRVIRIADVPFTDAIGRWNWNSTTSTDTTLKEAS